MSDYLVTARKWRPLRFEEVIGQSHVTVTLRNALAQKRLAHAYLFSGPRGVGKTTTARILAKAVNCSNSIDGNPDNTCEVCQEITEGRSFDVFEIDGASNRGVDEIRALREAVKYPPVRGSFKIYIIDEVHMLTKEAFNALLKTLEEPPKHVLFIFATTEIHKVPATIISRCQRFEFRRLSTSEITKNLREVAASEGVEIDEDALLLVARKSDGSLRDAQSMFDQLVSLCGKTVTYEQILRELRIVDLDLFFRVTDLIRRKDARGGLELVDEVIRQGYDLKEFLSGLVEHIRNILVVKTTGSTMLVEASDAYRRRYEQEAGTFSVPDLLRIQRMVSGSESSLRWNTQPRFKVEADIVQLITMDSAASAGELVQRISELKKKVQDEQHERSARPLAPPPAILTPTIHQSMSGFSPAPLSKSLATISEDDLRARWPQFVAEVRHRRVSLGSLIDQINVLGLKGDAVRIGCNDEFVLTSVKRNKQSLQEILQSVMNARVSLDPELQPRRPAEENAGHLAAVNSSTSHEEHPVVRALIRELGAEPIE
jgi:DNA polymerase-3 subunit gamma/tau